MSVRSWKIKGDLLAIDRNLLYVLKHHEYLERWELRRDEWVLEQSAKLDWKSWPKQLCDGIVGASGDILVVTNTIRSREVFLWRRGSEFVQRKALDVDQSIYAWHANPSAQGPVAWIFFDSTGHMSRDLWFYDGDLNLRAKVSFSKFHPNRFSGWWDQPSTEFWLLTRSDSVLVPFRWSLNDLGETVVEEMPERKYVPPGWNSRLYRDRDGHTTTWSRSSTWGVGRYSSCNDWSEPTATIAKDVFYAMGAHFVAVYRKMKFFSSEGRVLATLDLSPFYFEEKNMKHVSDSEQVWWWFRRAKTVLCRWKPDPSPAALSLSIISLRSITESFLSSLPDDEAREFVSRLLRRKTLAPAKTDNRANVRPSVELRLS